MTKTAKKATSKKTGGKKTKTKKLAKRKLNKSFWFDLTKDEVLGFKETSHNLKNEIDDETSIQTTQVETFKAEQKKVNAHIADLEREERSARKTADKKKEYREVECDEVTDWAKGEVRFMFGKKVMETRPLDEKEKQMAMTINQKAINEPSAAIEKVVIKTQDDIKDIIKEETSRTTKKSAVDPISPLKAVASLDSMVTP